MLQRNDQELDDVVRLSNRLMASRHNASSATSAVIECMIAAAQPVVNGLFSGGTLQERLLFTLVLAGACSTLRESDADAHGLQVSIVPENLREAFRLYTTLTGKSIQSYLPKTMVQFAGTETLN